jgi:Protein of unknown function (DUF4446)
MSLSNGALTVLCLLALVLSLAAIGVGVATAAAARRRGPTRTRRRRDAGKPLTGADVAGQLADVRDDVASAVRHLAVVRYDAFGDMGGQLSWSLALLDDNGDGVVVTSIHGRSDARTYAKNVTEWSSDQQLSPEEVEVIGVARGRG